MLISVKFPANENELHPGQVTGGKTKAYQIYDLNRQPLEVFLLHFILQS